MKYGDKAISKTKAPYMKPDCFASLAKTFLEKRDRHVSATRSLSAPSLRLRQSLFVNPSGIPCPILRLRRRDGTETAFLPPVDSAP